MVPAMWSMLSPTARHAWRSVVDTDTCVEENVKNPVNSDVPRLFALDGLYIDAVVTATVSVGTVGTG